MDMVQAAAEPKLPPSGSFCRVVYAALTMPRDAARHTGRGPSMRISGPNGTILGSQTSGVRRTSSGGFALPDTASATETRSVQRGKRALDVLDDLKIGLLSGNFDASTVSRLRDAAANLKSSSGDPGLDSVLSEIELRVEVELAKAGRV